MSEIKDFIEKTMNFGLGIAAWSREKIEALVEEMVQKGEIAGKDARKFAADLIKKGEDQRIELRKLVQDEITAVLDKMDLVRKQDVREQIAAALRDAGLVSESADTDSPQDAG
jgi:polyhydroxyalkanoate synthesis regulator phasin